MHRVVLVYSVMPLLQRKEQRELCVSGLKIKQRCEAGVLSEPQDRLRNSVVHYSVLYCKV